MQGKPLFLQPAQPREAESTGHRAGCRRGKCHGQDEPQVPRGLTNGVGRSLPGSDISRSAEELQKHGNELQARETVPRGAITGQRAHRRSVGDDVGGSPGIVWLQGI